MRTQGAGGWTRMRTGGASTRSPRAMPRRGSISALRVMCKRQRASRLYRTTFFERWQARHDRKTMVSAASGVLGWSMMEGKGTRRKVTPRNRAGWASVAPCSRQTRKPRSIADGHPETERPLSISVKSIRRAQNKEGWGKCVSPSTKRQPTKKPAGGIAASRDLLERSAAV